LLGDDVLRIEAIASPFHFDKRLEADLAARVVDAINLMGGAGEAAEACYQKALDGLARSAREVVAALAAEYDALPEDQYLDRWSLVQLMAELRNEGALDFIDRRLSAALPEERSADPHGFSSLAEEIMILTTAVEAATRMAADGNERALGILMRHATPENFSVRRAAIQGYLAHGGSDAYDALKHRLPERDHHILDIRRVDVRDVHQAEGGRFLACRDGRDDLPVHDLGADDGDGMPGKGGNDGKKGCNC
jgi:hypothetical protein